MNPPKRTRASIHLLSFAVVLLLCFGLAACTSSAKAPTQQRFGQQAIPVAVATVERRDLPVYLNGLGNITAFNTVNVKSRLDGQLVQVAFREGQEVKKGDLLAVIDPRPYEVQLEQAQATLFKDQSSLRDARINLERFEGLFKEGVIARQQLDTQSSLVGQLEGAVRADQAQIDNAKLNLVYTRVTAPVGGRVGLRQVDVGNMVHVADQNPMLVITQLSPIATIFTLPEDNLLSVAAHMRKGPLQVGVYSRDNQTKLADGRLLTIDNQIDTTTGTGRLKAIFENTDHKLWPNQFVNARLLLEVQKGALVVPAAAIQRGSQGTYTYVVKPDKTVEVRPVQVSLTQGTISSIKAGLATGEIVVTDGQDKLQAGSRVEIRSGNGPGNKPAQSAGTGAK
jgi:multidrug efflux system membrane fusion protein